MWIVAVFGIGVLVLAHTAPRPFLLDKMAGDRAVWHMPRAVPKSIYLTYDDGPNPATTPRRANKTNLAFAAQSQPHEKP